SDWIHTKVKSILNSSSETFLIKRAAKGDHAAFIELLKGCDRQLMSVVCRFTHDLYDREDLYQEIFLHCFKDIGKFRYASDFKTWLYRLALNRCIAYIKRVKPVTALDENLEGSSTDWERREKLAAVHRAMSRLSGPQRIAFHLTYVEDWSAMEIAGVLNCSQGTVKSHLDRARRKVRLDREVAVWQTT
ncbi:MAG: RNA polymerase sigma factor, partial [Pseudomonadales bacterium]|nr:RNA polymerase sigma factor [Pseudomonadales bacterium]